MNGWHVGLIGIAVLGVAEFAIAQKYDSSGNLMTTIPGLQAPGPLPKASSTSMTTATDQGSTASPVFGLTNTAVQIKASAGGIALVHCYNPNPSTERDYVLVYNSASPTVGTTTVVDFIPIGAPTDGHTIAYGSPAQYGGSVILVAAVQGPLTSPGGSATAPTAALNCSFWVQ